MDATRAKGGLSGNGGAGGDGGAGASVAGGAALPGNRNGGGGGGAVGRIRIETRSGTAVTDGLITPAATVAPAAVQ